MSRKIILVNENQHRKKNLQEVQCAPRDKPTGGFVRLEPELIEILIDLQGHVFGEIT